MNIADIKATAFAMPPARPAFPHAPYPGEFEYDQLSP